MKPPIEIWQNKPFFAFNVVRPLSEAGAFTRHHMRIKTIAVIGAGTMGRGIAYASALGGFRTILEDVSDSVVAKALDWIRGSFDEGVKRGKVDPSARDAALSLISTSHIIDEAIRDADLIIEAVPEELEMKLELFTIFDKFAKPNTIFASNTSSLSIGDFSDIVIAIAASACTSSILSPKCASWKLFAPRTPPTKPSPSVSKSPIACKKKPSSLTKPRASSLLALTPSSATKPSPCSKPAWPPPRT
jgi:hypothetical protein